MIFRKNVIIVFVMVLLVGLAGIIMLTDRPPVAEVSSGCAIELSNDGDTECVEFEIADTQELRQKGLSGRGSLADNKGVLFVFDNPGLHCMWMKDMNFSIDMLWLDESKKIVKIEADVSPDTYPENFCSQQPAKYVIELNAGVAQDAGLEVGQELAL